MANFSERLRTLRKERGDSLRTLSERCGISKSAIEMYESGKRKPKHEALEALADAFGVSISYLIGDTDEANAVPSAPLQESDTLPKNLRPVTRKRFPMLGEIACGEPLFVSEEHESYVDAGTEIDADFCLTVKGDSMIGARIHDGDVVFIRRQPIVENGEIAAVVIDDEATLKRWYYYPNDRKLVLTPENPAFAPLVFVGAELDSIVCLGKAVSFMSKL